MVEIASRRRPEVKAVENSVMHAIGGDLELHAQVVSESATVSLTRCISREEPKVSHPEFTASAC
jgi:hypothetical protein